ncbi:MAG: [Kiritimatiellae bacterium]|nr:[FeFe] hydrogenase, group A [Kiritimatiellia bacterium]
MDMVNLKVNGISVSVPKGTKIVAAAHEAGVKVPTLCYLKGVNEIASCRICMVEVVGPRGNSLVPACAQPVKEGMEVLTNTPRVLDARRRTLQLILSDHNKKCLSCVRNGKCELQELCHEMNMDDEDHFKGAQHLPPVDDSAVHMDRDNSKCILCRRCVSMCTNIQQIGVIGANNRGFNTQIGCAFERGLGETSCVSCGQCIAVCPTGALYEKSYIDEVLAAIADPKKHVVVQTAPSVRVGLGEEFGYPIGTDVEGKMAAALRRIGFDKVFDTDFGADLTIMEEANEFVERVKTGGVLPMITSCSPGWVKYCEHYYPDQLAHLSTCKSPQQMQGAVTKTYYAKKAGIDPKDIVSVSVMPCTAKKFEIGRDGQEAAGVKDVDYVLTTRELARMIKRVGLDFRSLPDETFDDPIGESTGAAVIFGATGGVMEAALRTAVETLTGETLARPEFHEVRGQEGIKEATYNVAGMEVKVAVASSTGNARKIMDQIRAGTAPWHFVEIMCCPGGCVNGGGQPQVPASIRNFVNVPKLRADALYRNNEAKTIRKSHENPSIKKIYADFLGKPGSETAHHVLHTHYVPREVC